MLVHVTEPVLLVLDNDQTELDELRETLHRRYGNEYVVHCENSAATATDRLGWLPRAARSRLSLLRRG